MENSGHVLIDKIYREMFRKLWIYAKIQLEDESLAEEAVQETFRIACEKSRDVVTCENPNGWIMNTLKYTIKGIKRDRTYLNKLYISLEVREEITEISENHVDIMYSDLINPTDFEMLKMIVLENKSIKDTAESFGITVQACKKRIERIKQRLKKKLEEQ